jgi:hypothetical protein
MVAMTAHVDIDWQVGRRVQVSIDAVPLVRALFKNHQLPGETKSV